MSQDFSGRVTENSLRTLVPTGNDSVQIFTNNRVIRAFDDSGQTPAGSLELLALRDVKLGALTLCSQTDVSGDRLGDLQLIGGARMRLRVVKHELAEQAAIENQRHEGERTDPFLVQDILVDGQVFIKPDIRDHDRRRVQGSFRPG